MEVFFFFSSLYRNGLKSKSEAKPQQPGSPRPAGLSTTGFQHERQNSSDVHNDKCDVIMTRAF